MPSIPFTTSIRRVFLLALVCVASACAGSSSSDDAGATPKKPVVLPPELDFELATVGGGSLRLADGLGRGPVILDFWATWCAPCKRAMPAYAALAQRYAEHGVQLWAVSWDHPQMFDRIGPYFERAGFTFPCLLDADKKVGRGLGVANLPTTFLVAPDGRVVWNHVGYADGDERELEQQLRSVLGLADDAAPGDADAAAGSH